MFWDHGILTAIPWLWMVRYCVGMLHLQKMGPYRLIDAKEHMSCRLTSPDRIARNRCFSPVQHFKNVFVDLPSILVLLRLWTVYKFFEQTLVPPQRREEIACERMAAVPARRSFTTRACWESLGRESRNYV